MSNGRDGRGRPCSLWVESRLSRQLERWSFAATPSGGPLGGGGGWGNVVGATLIELGGHRRPSMQCAVQ